MAQIIFTPTGPPESIPALPPHWAHTLKAEMVAEIEIEVMAMERPYLDTEKGDVLGSRADLVQDFPTHRRLLERRSALGLLELQAAPSEKELVLTLAPERVAQALYAVAPDWLEAFFLRHVHQSMAGKNWTLDRVEGLSAAPIEAVPTAAPATPPAGGSTRNWMAWLFVTPLLMCAVVLLFAYNWMHEVRTDYQNLRTAVDVQKEQILEAVERGVKSSTDVMDLIDLAKEWTAPEDSAARE